MAQHSKALIVSLISALLIMGLLAKPVQADHNDNLLVPLAGFVLLGSLLKHNHGHGHGYSNNHYGHQYGYSKGRYGHNGHNGGYAHNGHGGHQYNRRARSHSHEGYKRRPKRNNQH
jgi:hypothetical protein